jgi:putative heme-binding domain-containing protein
VTVLRAAQFSIQSIPLNTLNRWLLPLSLTFVFNWSAPIAVRAQTPRIPDPEAFRRHALTRTGNATRGGRLFAEDQRLACAKCHSIDGGAGKAGPDLYAVGDKFGRRDLVDAILMPSATISPGYGTVIVVTKDGRTVQGVLKQANEAGLQLMGGDGVLVSIAQNETESQEGSTVSLMPEGLQAGLSLQEFADLTEYLTTLKQPDSALAGHHGMPRHIPALAKPVSVRPFFTQELKVPPGRVQTGLTAFHQIPGLTNTFLVLHQKGLIWRMEKTETGETKSDFADLSLEVFSERGPNGLLDLAFHPKCRDNLKYYLKYQVFEEGTVATVVVEKQLTPDLRSDSGRPARRLIRIRSVAEDHSGGCLQFGPDGFLYFAMGDTGPHNDPNGHAQNMQLLLGKMMRIDVDHSGDGRAYAIPRDNPFIGQAGVPPEIWASGLRNPWRFCFDPLNGDLWLADVGQDRVEEVDLVRRGDNLGWSVHEGFEPFSNQYRQGGRTFTPPVFAYGRKYGNSITGGCVYRGDKASSFYGVYLCGDYTSKRLFGVTQENGVLKTVREIGTVPQSLVSFGRDEAGRLYAVGFEGMIYQLDFSESHFNEIKAD